MKKELGVHPYLFPMPVLMIATYGDDNVVDVMNMAWGGICAENMVSLNIDEDHKTSANIKKRGAFTLSIADIPHIEAADFFGIASGNKMPDKFERSGLSAVKSEKVDAPIVQEFPLTLECRVIEDKMEVYGHHIIGEIVGVLADEAVLDEKGKVDAAKLNAFVFDQFRSGYYAIGEKVGQAWHTGAPLMKNKDNPCTCRQTASSLCRSCFSGYDTKDARAFYANNEALMGKKKAVFLTAMADEDQKTASGANASFDLMADYLGWEIVGRLNVGGCSTADDLHEEDLTAAYELGKNL